MITGSCSGSGEVTFTYQCQNTLLGYTVSTTTPRYPRPRSYFVPADGCGSWFVPVEGNNVQYTLY
jgi:hypothetical protein